MCRVTVRMAWMLQNRTSFVIGVGGAAFGTATQAQSFQTQESCVDCHAAGRPLGVDVVHK